MKIKVGKYYLDKEQVRIVTDESKHLLVVAGAGAGKTLSILGKIKYLVETKEIDPKEIICISFTAKASDDLRNKIEVDLGLKVNVYTFHKLALEILKKKSSYEIADANLLDDIIREYLSEDILKNPTLLRKVLKYFGFKKEEEYRLLLEKPSSDYIALERLLSTFIHLFKSNAHTIEDFLKFLDSAKRTFNLKKYRREKILLFLALAIYQKYMGYLEENAEIDFDDMLIMAKKTVDKYGFFHKVKYIIIDEYQDTSLVRFKLVQSILDKTDSRLVAVGDDFQSIYRFTGCDLTLFLDFKKIFPDGRILKIQNTYRNSQELINVAGSFVMKNRAQMRKKLKSAKSIPKPIVIEQCENYKNCLTKCIYEIHQNTKGDIMILGRNNKDIDYFLDKTKFKIQNDSIFSLEFPEAHIRYLTAHKSKGLEADNVIIINLRNDILGFPNRLKDDSLLRFTSPYAPKYPFDEERRLFYVALTRTKNKVYLLKPKKDPSAFLLELEKDYGRYIEYV